MARRRHRTHHLSRTQLAKIWARNLRRAHRAISRRHRSRRHGHRVRHHYSR